MDFDFDDKDKENEVCDLNFKINIRCQQRNGRKSWTTIEGLENIKNLDLKIFTKKIKKSLCCNGSIKKSDIDDSKVLQFQGDHRDDIKALIIKSYNILEDSIIMHGF